MKSLVLLCSALLLALAFAVGAEARCQSQPIDNMPPFPKQFSTNVTITPNVGLVTDDDSTGLFTDPISIYMDVDNVHNRTHIVMDRELGGFGKLAIEAWGFVNADLSTVTVYTKVCAGALCRCQRDMQQLGANSDPDPWSHCHDTVYCGIGRSSDQRKCQVFESTCEGSDASFCVNTVPIEFNQTTVVGGVSSVTTVEFVTFEAKAPADSVFNLPLICNVRRPPSPFTNELPRADGGPSNGGTRPNPGDLGDRPNNGGTRPNPGDFGNRPNAAGGSTSGRSKRNVDQLSGADLLVKSTSQAHSAHASGISSAQKLNAATHHRNGEAHSSSPLPLSDRKHLAALERAMGGIGVGHNPAHLHTAAIAHAQRIVTESHKK